MNDRNEVSAALLGDVPLLVGPSSTLARSFAADGRLFSLGGRGARAWGSGLRGAEAIRAAGWTLRDLKTGLGPASNVVVDPGSVRREVTGANGTVLETLLLGQSAPAAILQWRRPEGETSPLALEIDFLVAWAGPEALSAEGSADLVRVSAGAGAGPAAPCVLLAVRPTPQRWDLHPGEHGLRVQAALSATAGAVSLLMAAGRDEKEARNVLRGISRARTEEVRVEQAISSAREDQLALHTGVAALDEGLEWAKARLRACPASTGLGALPESTSSNAGAAGDPTPLSPHVEECWVALGALAAGELGAAEAILEGTFPTPYHLLVAARYVGWSGATGPLTRHTTRLDEAVARMNAAPLRPIGLAALAELADAWESAGDKPRAAALRQASPQSPTEQTAIRRRLPVVGSSLPKAGGTEDLARAIIGGKPTLPYDPGSAPPASGVERALRAWALCRAGDPEAGYGLLREHVEAGFRSGWGIWSESLEVQGLGAAPSSAAWVGWPDPCAPAALIPAALLFGLLGASADASVGRLRLAPRFPRSWRSFRVSNIRVADARLDFGYQRAGAEHTFRVQQQGGRIPLMLVFEPEIADSDVVETHVDGRPAALNLQRARGRVRTSVQLPLETERVITLVGGTGLSAE